MMSIVLVTSEKVYFYYKTNNKNVKWPNTCVEAKTHSVSNLSPSPPLVTADFWLL